MTVSRNPTVHSEPIGTARRERATAPAPRDRRGGLSARARQNLAGAGFVSPAVLVVAVLLYVPFLWTAYLSFTEYDGLNPPTFTGVDNYTRFFDDPALGGSVRNTLMWAFGVTVVPVVLGLLVAVLSYGIRGGTWFRLPFLLPYALSGAGLAVVWGFLLQSGGAVNDLLGLLHLPGADVSFLLEWPYNTISMIVAVTWQQTGVNALLFLVGLQSIPKEYSEAARLDGATGWRLFRRITWPLLAPLTTVIVGLSLVASLKTFDIVWVNTQGGPGRTSETLAVTMYREAFVSADYGYGSAVALSLTVVTAAISYVYLRRQVGTGKEPD
ncbi:carbohydrate ABC transporter permease [Virgisporangium aurantiacum]|uniref:Permease n=1 Tax=Virgisporangium aurantiacum TaxID=175570 RepID=A0A8J4E2B4_9ACTN|nr:sugar ABC transporter permease [Virgisporangium aurantiacum]GIJ56862.1 permease [Virgisporangium aurantiacum]